MPKSVRQSGWRSDKHAEKSDKPPKKSNSAVSYYNTIMIITSAFPTLQMSLFSNVGK